ncbi:Dabb family protein [Egibacter rhizosphaerae]|uniref:Dabb family protein n=1 Tax=Egibacter rhizosphaerae TaxID=1670831 RepID=A0A411YAR5_9ACTN|nr:Dabb family protein [Egibacter rhizosphaerae]QBI18268.1 Dabb family protein [Egibacter rhizosphaerae]
MGVRHVALFRFVEGTSDEHVRRIDEALAQLPEEILELRSYVFGRDLGVSGGAWDYGVVADVTDVDAFVAYRDHPSHRRVVDDLIGPVVAERASMQLATP